MKHTEKFLKQRKFMMMLPVLVFPFVTLMFWALGGGKGSTAQAMPAHEGLNAKLPEAQFEEEREEDLWDKFSLYETAARDSAAYETARENDPYFDLIAFESKQGKPEADDSKLIGTFKRKDRLIDPNEAKVNSKLEQLYQEINRASGPETISNNRMLTEPQQHADITELEGMMEELRSQQDSPEEDDDDMSDINATLEKLMDIQHPERVRDRIANQKKLSAPKAFTVQTAHAQPEFLAVQGLPTDSTIIELAGTDVGNGFFDLDGSTPDAKPVNTAIAAIIHENQVLVSGSTVRLRLLNDVTINNQVIPRDHFIYGTCSITGERLLIEITSILNDQTLIPVSLSVYDLDGLEGIHIPGAISRDAAKQASDDALQNVQLMSMDQSLGAQAASAGIEATKGLLSKKVKLIKVTVKAGYQIFLQNKDVKQ